MRNTFSQWVKCGLLLVGGCALLMTIGQAAQAQYPGTETLIQRLDRLEKQNEALKNRLEKIESDSGSVNGQDGPASGDTKKVQKIVADDLMTQDKEKKAKEAEAKEKFEDEGYKVGTDMKINVRWDKFFGVQLETPNNDFRLHPGVLFQLDSVHWSQDKVSINQIGDWQDGLFFRRVRPYFDGVLWEVVEFNMGLALDSVQQDIVGLDEMWVGVTEIPILGTIRIGHQRVPQGFEGDMVSSNRAMTFLERASYADAFYQNFATGLWTGNSVLDQHMTWAAMAYRQERGTNGDDFADGEQAYTGRMTFLPIWENEGRCLVHLGMSATWREGRKPGTGVGGASTVQFGARPMIRDGGGVGDWGGADDGIAQPGNNTRIVDTSAIVAHSASVLGTEFFSVMGPFSVQAEWAWAFMNDALFPVVVNGVGTATGTPLGTLGYDGGYLQLSYFLTGENRGYDRRLGREATNYVVGPYTNAWLVRNEDGGWSGGWGAWEAAVRYSYLNLNDGPVHGGIMEGWELGLNWYLNPALKIQFEYLHNNRYAKDVGPGQVTGAGGSIPISIDALGIRTQIVY